MNSPTRTSRRLSQHALELSWAAPQVITHRLLQMAASGHQPSARDRKEFQLMGSEKLLAFQQSWLAMGMQIARSQWELALSLWAAPWLGRAPRSASAHAAALTHEATKVLAAGLAPVHGKAVANARRLSKRR